ncbi:unnamed protein product [Bursaphelenchus xylophilus]|uniref:(pine wood nematode) hypothetical protein n=1 Tax=Bursaphelenchus xylophilus TaxID=6326 RepID=A0A1I7SEQ4_BURXY|nr:unnamed protein product [Bursaphelenchus xylophilus]CAG9128252.1 unnamed protein product [Bursaphelenchus xylophilus]
MRAALDYDYLSLSLFLVKYFVVSGVMVAQLFCFDELNKKTSNSTVIRFVLTFSSLFVVAQFISDFYLVEFLQKQLWFSICILFVVLFGFIEEVKLPFKGCCKKAKNHRQMMLNKVRYPIQISIIDNQKSPIDFKV